MVSEGVLTAEQYVGPIDTQIGSARDQVGKATCVELREDEADQGYEQCHGQRGGGPA